MALTLSTLRTRAYSCVRARVAIIERSVGSVRDRRASPPKARSKPRGLFANAEQAVDIAPPGASLVQPSHYFMMEGARALRRVDLAPLAGREG
jgi:hypothetical protein